MAYLALGPFLLDLPETPSNLLLLVLVQDPGLEQCLRKGHGALDVCGIHALVILERLVKLVHTVTVSRSPLIHHLCSDGY